MLTFDQAYALAKAWIEIVSGGESVLLDETIERPYGWVFFYQSKRYLETGDVQDLLLGNAPILIDRYDAEIRSLGTGRPVEDYLAQYEQTIPSARLGR